MRRRTTNVAAYLCGLLLSTIFRLRGEGTLSTALAGILATMAWCRAWAEGMFMSSEGATNALHRAETAIAEATVEEDRKADELRHCPHIFIVAVF